LFCKLTPKKKRLFYDELKPIIWWRLDPFGYGLVKVTAGFSVSCLKYKVGFLIHLAPPFYKAFTRHGPESIYNQLNYKIRNEMVRSV
jgi:hypothetical protein